MDAREQLLRLMAIQDLAVEIQSQRAVVDGAPARIEAIEQRFRERNSEYVAIKERYDAIEADRRSRQIDLEALEESRKKFMEALMQVKNQREYSAVLKELDAVKSQISGHEDAVLKGMEEAEALKSDLDTRSAHIAKEREMVESDRARIEAEATAAGERIVAAEAERGRIEAELPAGLVANLRRVEGTRQGLFLVRVEKEMCQACYVRIRPQVYQEIRQAAALHTCGNCRRYLYFEPALRSPSAGVPPSDAGSDPMEAANGTTI